MFNRTKFHAKLDKAMCCGGGRAVATKLKENVYATFTPNGFSVALYLTDVVFDSLDGHLVLNTGTWYTASTKAIMNEVLSRYGYYIEQSKGLWYVNTADGSRVSTYSDGMVLTY